MTRCFGRQPLPTMVRAGMREDYRADLSWVYSIHLAYHLASLATYRYVLICHANSAGRRRPFLCSGQQLPIHAAFQVHQTESTLQDTRLLPPALYCIEADIGTANKSLPPGEGELPGSQLLQHKNEHFITSDYSQLVVLYPVSFSILKNCQILLFLLHNSLGFHTIHFSSNYRSRY